MEGDPKFEDSQTVPDFKYTEYAESLGLKGIRVESSERVGPAWDEALSADRPTILEFHADPEVPPLPPNVTLDQARKFPTSLVRDPSRARMMKQSVKELFDSIRK